jgi:hypothetical protein
MKTKTVFIFGLFLIFVLGFSSLVSAECTMSGFYHVCTTTGQRFTSRAACLAACGGDTTGGGTVGGGITCTVPDTAGECSSGQVDVYYRGPLGGGADPCPGSPAPATLCGRTGCFDLACSSSGSGDGTPQPAPCTGSTPCGTPGNCVAKTTYYKDEDNDNYSDGTTEDACTQPNKGYKEQSDLTAISGDCDDEDSSIHPDAENLCDGKDNDCDGQANPFSTGLSCNDDSDCCPGPDGSPHCVYGTCQDSSTFCGDMFCDLGENCPDATRATDLNSCPLDTDPCYVYTCENGCTKKSLPAGDYNYGNYPDSTLFVTSSWICEKESHCDGNGSCISDCLDIDNDGFGAQPSTLYNAQYCSSGSSAIDCNDENPGVHPSSAIYPSSPFCDCNPNTGNGFTQGQAEGPIDIRTSINGDMCFDGVDNDCDNLADCYDPSCNPSVDMWASSFSIPERICGSDANGYTDCSSNYSSEADYDRACCEWDSSCVIEGECVSSGTVHGEFPDAHLCGIGEWYGGDTYSQVCNLIVNDSTYPTLNYSHWGLFGDAGGGRCCGDDEDEYYTLGLDLVPACCDQPNMYALGGNCMDTLIEKKTWDLSEVGFCIEESQCLVNPNVTDFSIGVENATNIVNPLFNPIRCVNDGDYIGDHYCHDGEWTTRTAMVASQMQDVAKDADEFSIYCDTYNNVLNHYNYVIGGSYAEYYLNIQGFQCKLKDNPIPCTNKVCVLRYKESDVERVVFGTSLNHDVNSNIYSILEVLGTSRNDCNSQLGSQAFTPCGTGSWYNGKIKSLLFSKTLISPTNVLVGNWLSNLENIYGPILQYVSYFNPSSSYDYTFVSDVKDFDKIYIYKKGAKSILLIGDELTNQKFMSATYEGFNTDVCAALQEYYSTNPLIIPFDCLKSGDKDYFVTGSTATGYYHLFDDLGPKLRIK